MRTDAHLAEAADRSDVSSRERLVTRGLPAVRSIAVRFREFGVPLEDLVQEGSLGLLEAIDEYEPECSADFESYARLRIRRAMRHAIENGSTLDVVAGGSTPGPEAATLAHEVVCAIDHAVDALPERQRVVVRQHFGFDCDPQEIAQVAASLHVSQQRVRTIERDALYALRDELEPIVSPRSPRRPSRF
jgi:RNA polymerase sigma factor (sigma-70 family)